MPKDPATYIKEQITQGVDEQTLLDRAYTEQFDCEDSAEALVRSINALRRQRDEVVEAVIFWREVRRTVEMLLEKKEVDLA